MNGRVDNGEEEDDRPKYNAEFLFREIKILKDRDPIGKGAFGEVRYARCDSLLCAAKCVHDLFLEEYTIDRANGGPVEDFDREYAYLSRMMHPNVVQYIGYYIDHTDDLNKPYLLMELMDESLRNYLEKLDGPVPFHKTIDFTHDIALGLDYLHYNNMMHCDLSANNVLLLGCRAKISDFGQSTLVGIETGYRVRGKLAPGTPVYMPPEALREDRPEFCSSIDVFSLGVLMIQILTRLWPNPSPPTTVIEGEGPGSPDVELPVKEAVRRGSHLGMISHRHPLYQLAIYCIKDDENERPPTMDICSRLCEVKEFEEYKESQSENPFGSIKRTIASDREFDELQEEIKNLQQKNETLENRVVQLQFVIGKQQLLLEQSGTTVPSVTPPGAAPSPGATPNPVQRSLQQTPSVSLTPSSAPLPVQDLVVGNKKWKWYPCKKSPIPLYGGSAIAIGNRAYVSGQAVNVIYEFNPDSNSWVDLPVAPNASFALVSIGGLLTTVGGYNKQSYSNALYSLMKGQGNSFSWQQSYPPMKDSRVSPGATSNERYVVVAGGDHQLPGNRILSNSVEILDIQTKTWTVADRLPKPVKRLSLVLCGDRLCVLGGIGNRDQPLPEMFFASLQALASSANQRNLAGDVGRAFKFNNAWQKSGVPVVYGTCTVMGGNIILVGGWGKSLSDAVYLFDPRTQPGNPWRYIGPLAKARMDAMCTVLPGERMIVVGGRSQDSKEPMMSFAEIACPV